jgi:tuftelin-interacting protein 11
MSHGFKDLVQKFCEEWGILWTPIANRFREAEKVYQYEPRLQAYIDHEDLFVSQDGRNFTPMSVQSMLELCE